MPKASLLDADLASKGVPFARRLTISSRPHSKRGSSSTTGKSLVRRMRASVRYEPRRPLGNNGSLSQASLKASATAGRRTGAPAHHRSSEREVSSKRSSSLSRGGRRAAKIISGPHPDYIETSPSTGWAVKIEATTHQGDPLFSLRCHFAFARAGRGLRFSAGNRAIGSSGSRRRCSVTIGMQFTRSRNVESFVADG